MRLETKIKVPYLDLRIPPEEREILLRAIDRVFQHGRFILGPEIAEFEAAIATYCNRKYAVGVGSGTMALFLGLKAMQIGPGDEVITTSLSWIATANAIALTGATPVFADIGDDLNIDPKSVSRLITSKTKAIVPVHYTGKVCNMEALKRVAGNLKIIEDAAQAFGALYNGKCAGSFGDLACFSMNPMKIFAACGEAGVILTDDPAVHERLIALRYNGTVNKEWCIASSLNGRLDTIQAAILLHRFKKVDAIIKKRREIGDLYNQYLSPFVKVPNEKSNERDIYFTYQIQTPRRNELKLYLEERGIEVKIQHPLLMCQQSIYEKNPHHADRAKTLVQNILCLPMHEKLSGEQQEYVIDSIRDFFGNNQHNRNL